ncbi:hexokinase 1 [Schizosaccharomyces japonicus yFS275]|uniref:Phosphotransferase n=1 Tax=Schizosaccharomyces japonicus (strain yFS275 / FY16936) TaxID=402676 RepID=B6K6J9_SCHJY|nr:hexokinase 1 [Schizosaccharomyces japonicus yFS275]EEB09153.1 hexokinase 1 [Schizosaccharomyces japonicus yFS275]
MSLHASYVLPARAPSRKGSMIHMSKDLQEQVTLLEQQFSVSTEKLKEVTDHFVKELAKGLSKEGGSIPMIPTWVIGWPNGTEKGSFLALDMGGTNLRVCEVIVQGEGKFDIMQSKYRMPQALKTGTKEQLFDFIAESIKTFVDENHPDSKEMLDLGFTFSYPTEQHAIDHGKLLAWTKGFDIPGVEGENIVPFFNEALARKGCNNVRLTTIINDTTGTLIASRYAHPTSQIGVIFGTGCNAAYMEKFGNIPKLDHLDFDAEMPMAINCEWGAFDNEHLVLPRTKYDVEVDEESPRPGQQTFEKMVAGCYLGDIFRRVLVDLHKQGLIFVDQDITKIEDPLAMDASVLSAIEIDPYENLSDVQALFENNFNILTTEQERQLIRRAAELIGTRAARLSACGVSALVRKAEIASCTVGADGSVFNLYPHFQERLAGAIGEILGSEHGEKIKAIPAEDGSGVGAALIAALQAKGLGLTMATLEARTKK